MEEAQLQKDKEINKNEKAEDRVVRISSKDIEGSMKIYPGLTMIKGISWSVSNAICKMVGVDKNKKIGLLTSSEIKKVDEFIKNISFSNHLSNRKKDIETGEDKHLVGSDLELRHEFDIKKLKKIKSYRGYRHSSNLPLRGQRTRSNFRKNRAKGAGIKKKKKQ